MVDAAIHQPRFVFILTCFLTIFIYNGALLIQAQDIIVEDPDPLRFEKEISDFAVWDKKNSFPTQAVLFVGSSSIRLWHTHDAFPDYPLINRGFGGAHTSDVLHYYPQVVLKYKPSLILLYAGDNDIAAGKTAQQVYQNILTFLVKVKEDLPQSKVVFLFIKPSPSRWSYWGEMKKTNNLIEQYAENNPLLFCADVATPLLMDDGSPDKKLFLSDELHLNQEGYAKWEAVLTPLLKDTIPP